MNRVSLGLAFRPVGFALRAYRVAETPTGVPTLAEIVKKFGDTPMPRRVSSVAMVRAYCAKINVPVSVVVANNIINAATKEEKEQLSTLAWGIVSEKANRAAEMKGEKAKAAALRRLTAQALKDHRVEKRRELQALKKARSLELQQAKAAKNAQKRAKQEKARALRVAQSDAQRVKGRKLLRQLWKLHGVSPTPPMAVFVSETKSKGVKVPELAKRFAATSDSEKQRFSDLAREATKATEAKRRELEELYNATIKTRGYTMFFQDFIKKEGDQDLSGKGRPAIQAYIGARGKRIGTAWKALSNAERKAFAARAQEHNSQADKKREELLATLPKRKAVGRPRVEKKATKAAAKKTAKK